MSFQSFRLTAMPQQHTSFGREASAAPLSQLPVDITLHNSQLEFVRTTGQKKGSYGAGDFDDGYTLVFASMAAFQEWRRREEEENVVEFVKGDTHRSKAVPPRFKDHTKLVCARHSRNGRKKYVKKYPDRVRKVPSRKLEGVGCPASISYKTYYDSDEVRAMYIPEHSHEIGPANLLFTKRGRKAQAEQDARTRKKDAANGAASSQSPPSSSSPPPMTELVGPSEMSSPTSAAGPSSIPARAPNGPSSSAPPPMAHAGQTYEAAIAMLAPLPIPPPPQPLVDLSQERWDRMGVLYDSIRQHARTYQYPAASVAALESVLIRLYLESPIDGMVPPHTMGGHGMELGDRFG